MAGKRYSDPNGDDSDVTINKTKCSESDYVGNDAKKVIKDNSNKGTEIMSSAKSSNLSEEQQTGSPNGTDDEKDGQFVENSLVDKEKKDQVEKIQYIQKNNPVFFEETGENPDDLLSEYVPSDSGVTFFTEEEEITQEMLLYDENGFTYVEVDSGIETGLIDTSGKTVQQIKNPEEILKTSDDFAHPTGGIGRISSPFGFRILNDKWEFHGGTDYAARNGTKVYAVFDGVIQEANIGYVNQIDMGSGKNKYGEKIYRSPGGFGNSIRLVFQSPSDGEKYVAIYGHLQDVYVTKDQKVVKGQLLGTIGDTGFSYGNHLHFEIRNNKNKPTTVVKTNYMAGVNGKKPTGGLKTGFYGVDRIQNDSGDWVVNTTKTFVDPKIFGIV
jgi:murein DD-endopeptidase MepM/ murein hydrolase activator NlpD